MRLIDADALMKAIRSFRWFGPPNTLKLMFEYLRLIIRDQPTVDAVEVVRCRECKHYMTIHCTCDGCCISDNWYCADGERKDNERKAD